MRQSRRYPRAFGKYVLLSPLARGGMGELHLAVSGSDELKKLCAIKRILGYTVDENAAARFLDEAKVMVKLSHGNVVPVFESGTVDGQQYLVMEYIEGRDLRAVWNALDEHKRVCPLEVALHIAKQICRGLDYVHNYGDLKLVHRDISPPNVLLSFAGEVKVADFGLAHSRLKVQRTAPGRLFGKLSYMAPEQARRDPVDPRADVFSAGVILWELLTGRRLFPNEGTLRDRLQRAFSPTFEAPSGVNPALPSALDPILRRALAADVEKRYPSAELMRRDIAALLATIDPTTDATTVQRLLRELLGEDIDKERQQRSDLLEGYAPDIRRLQLAAKPATHSPALQPIATRPDGFEILGEKAIDVEGTEEDLEAGTVLGERYQIDERIGSGGMGVVYRATHIGIDRQVAVKVLHPLFSWLPDIVSRFQREAKAASRIGHPNIVEIFDAGTTEDGCLYFAMEYLEGEDLADVLRADGALPVQRAVNIGLQVCHALHAAHRAGVVHRDLKPENVFVVSKDGEPDFVKLLDFGIAQNLAFDPALDDRLTNPGLAMGTPEYMAPEQAAGRACDHRADIYATGAILYEMLGGSPPDAGEDTMDVFQRKATGLHTPIAQLCPEVSEPLAQLIHASLAFELEERPQSAGQVAYELTRTLEGRPTAVAALLGLAYPHGGAAQQPPGLFRPEVTGAGYPAVVTPAPFSGPDEFQAALQTMDVPTMVRPKHPLWNVAIGLGLVAVGIGIGVFTVRGELEPQAEKGAALAVRQAAPTAAPAGVAPALLSSSNGAADIGLALLEADADLAGGRYARAIARYRRVLVGHPNHPEATRGLKRALQRRDAASLQAAR